MAWVRQRCQDAPVKTAPIDFFSPSWESGTTSVTPLRPRATRPLKNAVQPAPSSALMTSTPRISRWPSAFTPAATTEGKEPRL
jgi:hypothetical protein